MSSTSILITGGTGFAGSHLVEELVKRGETNVHVTSFATHPSVVHDLLPADHIHQVNLQDKDATKTLLAKIKPQHIYHLAALAAVGSSFTDAENQITNNTLLQLSLLEAVKAVTAKARVLVVGSAQEYDVVAYPTEKIAEDHPLGPISPYAVSKVTQDLLGLSYHYAYKLDVVRVRPFNHIGERQALSFAVPNFAQQIAQLEKQDGGKLLVGNLEGVRDFTDVKDTVKAYILLMENGVAGEVYNVGSGVGVKMQSVVEQMIQLSHITITLVQDPAKLRPLDALSLIADNGKIGRLGWQPSIPLEQTLNRVLDYWRAMD